MGIAFLIEWIFVTEYECASQDEPTMYPKLIVFITGKGPQKEHYREQINRMEFRNVEINLPWLEHQDYPQLLGTFQFRIQNWIGRLKR
jgi:hypothetical protein